ncbi:MAG: amino acid permease [Bacteroidetes bacterium]|nr:amino acid permease [Bacteroidota bacterium]
MDFKKEIKLFDAVMLVAGTMIGSGIFIVSSDMARELGSSGWLLVAWLLSGVITVIGALSYGELSGMFPKAGGQYTYLKEAYGPFVSFLYGWTLFLVIQTGTIAAVGVAFAKFSGVLFEPLSENNVLITVGKFKVSAAQFLGIGVTILLTFLKNNVTFAGDEVVNPTKTLPRALMLGTGLVTVIYILVNVVYLGIIPLVGQPDGKDAYELGMQFAKNDRVAISAAWLSGGNILVYIMAILIMVSTFGCQNGCILSGARVYYSMAKDGLFFKPMAKLNSKGVPAFALWLQCIWACVLCLSGNYGNLLNYVMFAVVLFYILTIAGIFVLRRTRPEVERPYKAPLYPVLPLLYIILAGAFVYILFNNKQDYTIPGLIIIATGIPVYYLFNRAIKRNKEVATK